MTTNIRNLTDEGILEFQEYLDKARNGESVEPPFHLINDSIKSHDAGLNVSVEEKAFSNRYDFGVYLWEN